MKTTVKLSSPSPSPLSAFFHLRMMNVEVHPNGKSPPPRGPQRATLSALDSATCTCLECFVAVTQVSCLGSNSTDKVVGFKQCSNNNGMLKHQLKWLPLLILTPPHPMYTNTIRAQRTLWVNRNSHSLKIGIQNGNHHLRRLSGRSLQS